jgi:hypothetical protein
VIGLPSPSRPKARSAVNQWRTGFHHIALGAQVPMVVRLMDYGRKIGGLGPAIMPTGDYKADMQQVAEIYQSVTPKHPERGIKDFAGCSTLEGLIIDALALAVMMALLARAAAKIGDVSFIDAVWGAGMAVLAASALAQAADKGPRASLIAAMAVIWGARLGIHLYTRWRAHGEDLRYARMLGKARKAGGMARRRRRSSRCRPCCST